MTFSLVYKNKPVSFCKDDIGIVSYLVVTRPFSTFETYLLQMGSGSSTHPVTTLIVHADGIRICNMIPNARKHIELYTDMHRSYRKIRRLYLSIQEKKCSTTALRACVRRPFFVILRKIRSFSLWSAHATRFVLESYPLSPYISTPLSRGVSTQSRVGSNNLKSD